MVTILTLFCAACVGVLLYAEKNDIAALKAASKTLASLTFIGVALVSGAADTLPGRMILLGLVLSATGDVLLLWDKKLVFLGGMGAFGLAHVAYSAGFVTAGPLHTDALVVGVLVAALISGLSLRWLWPNLGEWQKPVLAYGVIISIMVALGVAAMYSHTVPPMLGIAAIAFALSDISVAQDRLVKPDFSLRAWGLPLYYGAQILFAIGAGLIAA